MSFVGTVEQVYFDRGYSEHAAGEQPRPAVDNPDQLFWYRAGWNNKAAGAAKINWDSVTKTALSADERKWYEEGHATGVRVRSGLPAAPVSGPVGNPAYGEWLNAGIADGRNGLPPRYIIAGQKAPVIDNSNAGPPIVAPPAPIPRPAPRYQRYRVLEVCAFAFGRRVPLDLLLTASKFIEQDRRLQKYAAIWLAFNSVRVFGAAPGDELEGYRLSGPDGAAAKLLSWLEAQGHVYRLADYNLPAWFAARVSQGGKRGGIRFLSRPELMNLGIDPDEYV